MPKDNRALSYGGRAGRNIPPQPALTISATPLKRGGSGQVQLPNGELDIDEIAKETMMKKTMTLAFASALVLGFAGVSYAQTGTRSTGGTSTGGTTSGGGMGSGSSTGGPGASEFAPGRNPGTASQTNPGHGGTPPGQMKSGSSMGGSSTGGSSTGGSSAGGSSAGGSSTGGSSTGGSSMGGSGSGSRTR